MNNKTTQTRLIARFGEKLRELRIRQNLTLQSLAHLMGHTAHGYISELERGKKLPTVELVLRLARLFNVTTDELLRDELEIGDGRRTDTTQIMEHTSRFSDRTKDNTP